MTQLDEDQLRADSNEAHELGGFLYWYMVELSNPPLSETHQVILSDLMSLGVQRWLERIPWETWSTDTDPVARRTLAAKIQSSLEGPDPDMSAWREERNERED